MSDLVLDASLALQWFLEDETDRQYSLEVLASLVERRAVVPVLWFYEVGNGLLMAHRRKRITLERLESFLTRLKGLPIEPARQTPAETLDLPVLAHAHALTNYDAAYPALAIQSKLPLATKDGDLLRAAASAGVRVFTI